MFVKPKNLFIPIGSRHFQVYSTVCVLYLEALNEMNFLLVLFYETREARKKFIGGGKEPQHVLFSSIFTEHNNSFLHHTRKYNSYVPYLIAMASICR